MTEINNCEKCYYYFNRFHYCIKKKEYYPECSYKCGYFELPANSVLLKTKSDCKRFLKRMRYFAKTRSFKWFRFNINKNGKEIKRFIENKWFIEDEIDSETSIIKEVSFEEMVDIVFEFKDAINKEIKIIAGIKDE